MKYKELKTLVSNLEITIGNQETKLEAKLQKVYKKIEVTYNDYLTKIDELRLDNALTDEKNALILDEKGKYKFSKEGLKKLIKDIDDLNDQDFTFKKIPVVNPQGLEEFTFLKDWLSGIEFKAEEAEEEL